MNGDTSLWWGFRLRLPFGYQPEPLRRLEVVALFGMVAIVLEILWLVWLLGFAPLVADDSFWAVVRDSVLAPIVLAALPIGLGLALPPGLLANTLPGAFLVLARERGNLRKWDLIAMILGVAGLGLALARLEGPVWVTEMALLVLVLLVCLDLMIFLPGVDFSKRRWKVPLPSWLIPDGGGSDVVPIPRPDEKVEPEPDSNFRWPLRIGGESFEVGIRIGEELVEALRAINREKDGRLFNENPLSVILMDRPPVQGSEARGRIVALARQIAILGHRKSLTRYLFADSVLHLVQESIKYAFDKPTTGYDEYGRFPPETLFDGVGDCECTALLCASLLAHLGFDVGFLHVKFTNPSGGKPSYHAAVGLDASGLLLPDIGGSGSPANLEYVVSPTTGKRYLYGETAVDGGTDSFGTIPQQWRDTMTVEKIDEIPAVRSL
jgi:hypothetical protein